MNTDTQKNAVALVTGGGRGLGRDMAIRLAEAGNDVIITYVQNKDAAHETVKQIKEHGVHAAALPFEQRDPALIPQFVEEVRSLLTETCAREHIDILVNNAGTGVHETVDNAREATIDEMVDIHFKGVALLTSALLPHLSDGGRIINISSGLTRFSFAGYGTYAAMKGAIEVYTRYLAKELAPRAITANCVAPGAIDTDFNKEAFENNPQVVGLIESVTALGRVGHADDIGGIVAFLASEDAKWITGERIEASGGMFL